MKFAVVVGHTEKDKGAAMVAPFTYLQEYEYNTMLAAIIQARLVGLKQDCQVIFRDNIGVSGAYKLVEDYQPLCAVELHFNGGPPAAVGTETLYGVEASGEWARLVHTKIMVGTVRPQRLDRGVKLLRERDRGYGSVSALTAIPTCLVEPFFGSNKDDALFGIHKQTLIANAIVGAFLDYGERGLRGVG